MAFVTGVRQTLNVEQTQREVDFADRISLLEPDAQPLAIFSRKAGKAGAISPKFEWFEDELDARFDQINNGAGYASGATSIVVDNGPYFQAGDIFQVTRTGENISVTSVSTNTLTVVRGIGSTAAAIVDDDELLILGSAREENALSRTARTQNPTPAFNYTQIFRQEVSESETMRSSTTRHTPHDWPYQQQKKGIEHAKDIEYHFLHGGRSETAGTEGPRRTTGGVIRFITTNQTDAGGAFSVAEWNAAQRSSFRYGKKEKLALASPLASSVLNSFAADKVQIRQDETTFGVKIMRFVSIFGTLNLVPHWLLEGAKYGGYIVILDMDVIRYRFLNGGVGDSRDTKLLPNRQENDRDGRKDEWLTECGLEVKSQKKHALVTGITS